jgi:hypothetical protein
MMRKLSSAVALAGLLALAGMAAADGPAYQPAPPATKPAPPATKGAPVTPGTPVVVVAPAHEDCGCVQKRCKPITDTRKVIKPHYTHVCEDYCEVSCLGCTLLGGGCCGEHGCTRVKTRKILVVRLRPEEQCVNKCVVDYKVAPPCHTPCVKPVPCATPAPVATPHRVVVPAPAPAYLPGTPRSIPEVH